MYFSCGPPRVFGVPSTEKTAKQRYEHVTVAIDSSMRFLARVSSSHVSVWSSDCRLKHQKLLCVVERRKKRVYPPKSPNGNSPPTAACQNQQPKHSSSSGQSVKDLRNEMHTLWAIWLADLRLAVVEKGSRFVEFYQFEEQAGAVAGAESGDHNASETSSDTGATNSTSGGPDLLDAYERQAMEGRVLLKGKLVDVYQLNLDERGQEVKDVATCLCGIIGSKYLFIGMQSGLISVVQVTTKAESSSSWLGGSSSSIPQLWKIDVIAHLMATKGRLSSRRYSLESNDGSDLMNASNSGMQDSFLVYAMTCAPLSAVMENGMISKVCLVTCFENGPCFLMVIQPSIKSIEHLLSLENKSMSHMDMDPSLPHEHRLGSPRPAAEVSGGHSSEPAAIRDGFCSICQLDRSGSRLALGWSDGAVLLFRLRVISSSSMSQSRKDDGTGDESSTGRLATSLSLEPLQELNLLSWGYTEQDLGSVVSLAWSWDSQAIAIGYELRGFCVFSVDGCRLMSSLPQHNQPRVIGSLNNDDSKAVVVKESCAYGVMHLIWTRECTSLVVVPRGEPFAITQVTAPATPISSLAPAPAADATHQQELGKPEEKQPAPSIINEEVEESKQHSEAVHKQHFQDLEEDQDEEDEEKDVQLSENSLQLTDLYEEVDVSLLKEDGGLCLSLSGAPARCGAWVRGESSFTRRADGSMGPAEASGKICGGDLLIGINGKNIEHLTFEEVVKQIKDLPNKKHVTLRFLRMHYDSVFELAANAFVSRDFQQKHDLYLDEDVSIREFALRMQTMYGDVQEALLQQFEEDEALRPPTLLEIERRAKFEAWESVQGTSQEMARQKYVKLFFAVFPIWNPLRLLSLLVQVEAASGESSSTSHSPVARAPVPAAQTKGEAVACATASKLVKQDLHIDTTAKPAGEDEAPADDSSSLHNDSLPSPKATASAEAESPPGSPDGSPIVRRFKNTQGKQVVPARKRKVTTNSMVEFEFTRALALSGRLSSLVLLESNSVRLVAQRALDDANVLSSCVSLRVPEVYESKCAPLRLASVSPKGDHLAVAGQMGFCLFNKTTNKWRLFGNINEESDLFVSAMEWFGEDILFVIFSKFSEGHEQFYLRAYPRNHLDEQSVLAELIFAPPTIADMQVSQEEQEALPSRFVYYYGMEIDMQQQLIYCLSAKILSVIAIENLEGSLKGNDLQLSLEYRREVKMPLFQGRVMQEKLKYFAVIPRLVRHKQQNQRDEDVSASDGNGWFGSLINMIAGGEVPEQYQPHQVLPRFLLLDQNPAPPSCSDSTSHHSNNSGGGGNAYLWDPESRSHRLLSSNVTKIVHFEFPSSSQEEEDTNMDWPLGCHLIFGLYGPEGMKLWLPMLDGVFCDAAANGSKGGFFGNMGDAMKALQSFLAVHDPLRAKTFEIEFAALKRGNSLQDATEKYRQIVQEYGIELDATPTSVTTTSAPSVIEAATPVGEAVVDDSEGAGETSSPSPQSFVCSLDYSCSRDIMMRFDAEVTLLDVERTFGLLIGISQDVYVPTGGNVPCYDVFCRVQPFFHTLLCFCVAQNQLTWTRRVLRNLQDNFALATWTRELFLHSMLENCFHGRVNPSQLHQALGLLREQPTTSGGHEESFDEEYCELVANVARKSEPSRLKLLFPSAGEPLELLSICRQRRELRTAANFLLILDETTTGSVTKGESTTSSSSTGATSSTGTSSSKNAFRSACAAELVVECIEQEEWDLAKHVVRVAREWDCPEDRSHRDYYLRSIDEQLSKFMWHDAICGRFDRVVWCLEELHAKFPLLKSNNAGMGMGMEMGLTTTTPAGSKVAEEEEHKVVQQLEDTLHGNVQKLESLLQAVKDAKYVKWIALLQKVINSKKLEADSS